MKFITQELMKLKSDRDYVPLDNVRVFDKLTDAMNYAEKTISSFQRNLPFLIELDDVKIVIYSAEEFMSYDMKGGQKNETHE